MVVVETTLGWAAALTAICFNGSFGVPIKSETCRRLDIDPLVFQTYKTVMCLVFSWMVVWHLEIPIRFSPWGIVSGLFWVPNGVATVKAVKLLGLGLAVAVGNSLLALVSFTWGIFIFHEKVNSKPMACLGVLMMIVGFIGMSFFSSSSSSSSSSYNIISSPENKDDNTASLLEQGANLQEPLLAQTELIIKPSTTKKTTTKTTTIPLVRKLAGLSTAASKKPLMTEESSLEDTSTSDSEDSTAVTKKSKQRSQRRRSADTAKVTIRNRKPLCELPMQGGDSSSVSQPSGIILLPSSKIPSPPPSGSISINNNNNANSNKTGTISICNREISNFKAGLLIAVCGNIWGGSVMIPMKMCHDDTSGPGYLISFSSGASIVTLAWWILRLWYNIGYHRSIKSGYQALPSFYLREMWLLGGLSGILWSIGHFFAILSVHYLGAGVGYCVVQASMLVGGMWGICYFKEVSGKIMIAKWFLSALVTISGIIVLALEKR